MDRLDLNSPADLGKCHPSDHLTTWLNRASSRGGCHPRAMAALLLAAAAAPCLPAAAPAAFQTEMLTVAGQMARQSETSPAGPYDGDWSGTTDQGKPVSFTIVNNAVAVFSIGYLTSVSSCQQNSSVTFAYNPPRNFIGDSFSIEEIHVPGLSVDASGFFDSGTHALGAAVFSFSQASPTCISDGQASWEATKQGPTDAHPNLSPYQPSGWSDRIVVSKTTGTNSDSIPLAPTDSLYVDWAVANNGTVATGVQFFTELYVDGGLRQSWHTDPPLNANSYTFVLDYPIGSLSLGNHTIRIRTDATSAIVEANEGDNEYTKTIIVGSLLSGPAAFVIPVVGSAPGSFGSFFRTGVQVLNAGGAAVSGRFIYHPASVSGTSTDPGLDFSIPQGATLSYADLVQAMGQTGVGSLDVVVPANGRIAIVTRVFNDAGAGGTSGFTEAAAGVCNSTPCPPGSLRSASVGPTGYFIAPADPARFRFNIGVRTLELGAALRFDVYDASGRLVQSVNKAYGPNYFIQQSAEVFLGLPLPANYSVVISLTSGNAIVYGATIDNTTNDSSIQITGILAPAFG